MEHNVNNLWGKLYNILSLIFNRVFHYIGLAIRLAIRFVIQYALYGIYTVLSGYFITIELLMIPYIAFNILFVPRSSNINITNEGIYCHYNNQDNPSIIKWNDIHQICQLSNHKAHINPDDYYVLIQTKDWISSVILVPSKIYVDGIDKTASYKAENVYIADTLCARAKSVLHTDGKKGHKFYIDDNQYFYDVGNYTGYHENKEDSCDGFIFFIIRSIEAFLPLNLLMLFLFIILYIIFLPFEIWSQYRRKRILSVIRENGPVKLSTICQKTRFKKKLVSDLLQEFKKEHLVRYNRYGSSKGWVINEENKIDNLPTDESSKTGINDTDK